MQCAHTSAKISSFSWHFITTRDTSTRDSSGVKYRTFRPTVDAWWRCQSVVGEFAPYNRWCDLSDFLSSISQLTAGVGTMVRHFRPLLVMPTTHSPVSACFYYFISSLSPAFILIQIPAPGKAADNLPRVPVTQVGDLDGVPRHCLPVNGRLWFPNPHSAFQISPSILLR